MASDVGETPCKKRKPNWTADECLYLAKLVEDNKGIWHDLHMKGKSELSDHRKQLTGGGPSQCAQISPIAEAVGNVIGMGNVSICGIEGAVDTSVLMLLDSNTSDSSAISRSSDILLTDCSSTCTLATSPEERLNHLRKEKLELEIKKSEVTAPAS